MRKGIFGLSGFSILLGGCMVPLDADQRLDLAGTYALPKGSVSVRDHDGIESISVYDWTGREIYSESADGEREKIFSFEGRIPEGSTIKVRDLKGNSFRKGLSPNAEKAYK